MQATSGSLFITRFRITQTPIPWKQGLYCLLQKEIEATVSRINYLKGKVSYSTIDLEFYQTINEQIASIETDSVVDNFKKALSVGWEGVVWFLIAITYIWPLIVSGIAAGTLYWFKRKRILAHSYARQENNFSK